MNKQAWIECALQKGMESFEIYESLSKQREVTWFQGQMDTFVTSSVLGTSIRGVYNGKMAYMALEEVKDTDMESTIDALIDQAKTVTSEDIDKIREPQESTPVEHHKDWVQPSMEKIQSILKELEAKIMAYDPRIIQVTTLGWQEAWGERSITNSYGMEVHDEDRMQILVAGAACKQDEDIKDDYNVEVVYDLSKFDKDTFVKELCERTLYKLGAVILSSRTCPVIFEKDAMTSLFGAFTGLFSGDLIYKGISPLKDKLNTKVFSEKITVIDNPRNTDALSIANFDDEGCPTKEKVLVENGIFTMMLHNTKSALQMHTESTGNGFKAGYASSVGVSPMNCYIVPGEKSLEQLCEEMKDGFVITDLAGLHAGIDFVTTNFSLQCSGYWVKDGKRDQSVTLVTVAANFLELMKKVTDVGSDLDWKYRSVVAPSIAFASCAISGE